MALILKKSVFYHIPKTGGSWVSTVLRDMGLVTNEYVDYKYPRGVLNLTREHISPRHARLDVVGNLPSFAFVRNPVTWYQSFWRYKQSNNGWDDPYIKYKSSDFNEFMTKIMDAVPGFLTQIYKEFEIVSFTGKQENLFDDLVTILEALGEQVVYDIIENIPPINVSPRKSQPGMEVGNFVYDPKVLKRMKKLENWIFKKYYPEEL